MISDSSTGLKVDTPNWSAPNHIRALTTTRQGGVSNGVYDSFNLGGHVKDNDDRVLENRQILIQKLGLISQPVWLDQVHGTDILELTHNQYASPPTADGSYTNKANVVCAILTADCMPVFLTNRQGSVVSLLHAGWRSLAAGIIERGVKALGSPPADVIAWAGPCIGPENFEVGKEVQAALGESSNAYKPSKNAGKVYTNLYRLAGERLRALGVREYSHSSVCTYRDQSEFFSYRRSGQCGRMASLIWIER